MKAWKLGCLGLLLVFSFPSRAKTFKSQFIKLDLPQNWDCKQEELDWVCQPDNLAERNEVILIIVTKPIDEVDDNFDTYESILNTPQNKRDLLGNSYVSEIKYTRKITLLEHVWVDSLQFGSEIPGFFTRYVASIKEKVAGLVTYSIAETAYPKWADVMDAMVSTLKLQFDPKAFADLQDQSASPLLGSRNSGKRLTPSLEEIQNSKSESKDSLMKQILLGLVFAAAIGLLIFRIRKKKQKT